MENAILILSLSTAVSVTGFIVIAILWMKKLREAVGAAIIENAGQQIRAAQTLNETIAKIHKDLRSHDQQFQTLALSHSRLKHDLEAMQTIALRPEPEATDPEEPSTARRLPARTVH